MCYNISNKKTTTNIRKTTKQKIHIIDIYFTKLMPIKTYYDWVKIYFSRHTNWYVFRKLEPSYLVGRSERSDLRHGNQNVLGHVVCRSTRSDLQYSLITITDVIINA